MNGEYRMTGITLSLAVYVVLATLSTTHAATLAPALPKVGTLRGPSSHWKYEDSNDKMRGTSTHIARLESRNSLTFDFPYRGGTATLMLRNRAEDGLKVMLSVEGQFLCDSNSGDSVAVKFDSGSIQQFACSEPDSGNPGLLFIDGAEDFVTALSTARTLTIEANFYQEGPRQMEFDVAGLNTAGFVCPSAGEGISAVAAALNCMFAPVAIKPSESGQFSASIGAS